MLSLALIVFPVHLLLLREGFLQVEVHFEAARTQLRLVQPLPVVSNQTTRLQMQGREGRQQEVLPLVQHLRWEEELVATPETEA